MVAPVPNTRMHFTRSKIFRGVLALSALAIIGFISNWLSIAACDRATRRWVDACYHRAAPALSPPLTWVEPGPLEEVPNVTVDGAEPVYSSFRARLFKSKIAFHQLQRAQYQPGFRSSAFTVLRKPLPFIARVHYFWEFTVPNPAHSDSRGGSGVLDWGVATYVCLFGLTIPLYQGEPPA